MFVIITPLGLFWLLKGWTGPYKLLAWNTDQTAAILDINDNQSTFRITAIQQYYKDDSTIVITPDEYNEEPIEPDDEYHPEPESEQPPRRGHGRPKGSKNKPKDVHLTQREQNDIDLATELRAAGKITTFGKPFEQSTKEEIDALIARGVFRFELYNSRKHRGTRIFKSRTLMK